MEYTLYAFNGTEILLIKISSDLKTSRPHDTLIHHQVDIDIDTLPSHIHYSIVRCVLSKQPNCTAIIYSTDIEYLHSFKSGLRVTIAMEVGVSYRQDRAEYDIDQLFRNKLRPMLVGRMHEPFIDIYLHSLRASLIKEDALIERIIWKNGLSDDHETAATEMPPPIVNLHTILVDKIRTLSKRQINIISKVILNNELTYATSSNVFNLHKAEPQQQNSLNVKQTNIITATHAGDSSDSNCNKNYKCIRSMYDEESIQSGMTYVFMTDNLTFIRIRMNYCKFMEFVARNYFFCFKITSNDLACVEATVGLVDELFNDFRQININHKLIQFNILAKCDEELKELEHTEIKFAKSPCLNVWQSGDAKLLKIMSFSEETLNSNVKTFDVYAIVCMDFMDKFLRQTRCSVTIRRVVVFNDLRFYYALFCVNIQHVGILSTLVAEYQQRCCRPVILDDGGGGGGDGNGATLKSSAKIDEQQQTDMLDVLWGQRKCCSLIYQTYFKWINDALYMKKNEQHIQMLTETASMNLIHYKYINETKNLDTVPRTADDAETFAQILIETKRNIFRDIVDENTTGSFKSKRVKFSPFDGIKDGPMVAAVSVRTCEKITNGHVLDREWPVNVTNVTMLLNTPDYRGVQNPTNSLKL